MKFWILWGFDVLVALVVVYFFLVGLNDGSVSSFNMGLWTTILAVLAVVMGGSVWLKSRGQTALAVAFLLLLALPALFFAGFSILLISLPHRWN